VSQKGSHLPGPSPFLRDGRPFRLDAVVFDFDGTLTEPGALDFAAIHEAVGCPREIGLLEFLAEMTDEGERRRKEDILNAAELEAASRCRANEGAAELVAFLRAGGIPMAIITRNSREAVERASLSLPGINPEGFAVVVTRDVPLSPKPLPDGVEFIARELGVEAARLLVIGDHAFDVEAGRRAGAVTMFLRNNPAEPEPTGGVDFMVDTLAEALAVIRFGLPLPPGKLPADLLERSLAGIHPGDPAVLVGAAVGEDAAVIDVSGDEALVLASDPITLAIDSMARYTVLVNANDVATSGATPRWLLSTLLFPPGSSASEVLAMTRDIQEACAAYGVALCGGHTEISDAVSRPLVVGTMAGVAALSELVDKRDMREGDHILLTKGVAIEGTGLIAREFGARLLEAGLSAAEIAEAAGFLERIGILEEAGIARTFAGVTALHDVTEGGLATAVREMGAAGGRRLRLHLENIPVYPQTARICAALGLDPLGLIGSGSLLITCSAADAGPLREALTAAGIEVADIGEVGAEGEGIEAFRDGLPAEWPAFARDEVSRLSRFASP
jgi:hydrogenase expression/formation protein HypE